MTPIEMTLMLADATGLSPSTIGELPAVSAAAMLADVRRPPGQRGAKWTRGELAAIVRSNDGDAALEVLKYLDERGPRCVSWLDETVPRGGIGCECPGDCPEHGEAAVDVASAEPG
jgi:hypothetical protein